MKCFTITKQKKVHEGIRACELLSHSDAFAKDILYDLPGQYDFCILVEDYGPCNSDTTFEEDLLVLRNKGESFKAHEHLWVLTNEGIKKE